MATSTCTHIELDLSAACPLGSSSIADRINDVVPGLKTSTGKPEFQPSHTHTLPPPSPSFPGVGSVACLSPDGAAFIVVLNCTALGTDEGESLLSSTNTGRVSSRAGYMNSLAAAQTAATCQSILAPRSENKHLPQHQASCGRRAEIPSAVIIFKPSSLRSKCCCPFSLDSPS